MAVQHEFGLRRRAGCEIQQHRIVRAGRSIRLECLGIVCRLLEPPPAFMIGGRSDNNFRESLATKTFELRNLILRGDDDLRLPAFQPVTQFVAGEQCRRRNGNDAKLHCRQHGLPQRHDIAEQQQEMIATLQAEIAQKIRGLVGAARHGRE